MTLIVPHTQRPMEATTASELPVGKEWEYEPKWDGFRCLAFRDATEVDLRSKSGKPLTRYFPEVVAAIRALRPKRFVLDGEIVIVRGKQPDFDALLQRIHPAASRVARLAAETPATFVAFDLLEDSRGRDLRPLPQSERRARLESMLAKPTDGVSLSPATKAVRTARRWLTGRVGTDGVVAKRRDLAYHDDRSGMIKVKRIRTADCVVGGFRYGVGSRTVASLLLGLYDDDGLLNHVGFTSALSSLDRRALTETLDAMVEPPGFTGRAPGGPSRWSTDRSADWKPVRPELVVEVKYDHVTGGRFRHGTTFLRWRPDKDQRACTMDQLL